MIKRGYSEQELLKFNERSPDTVDFSNKEILLHFDSFCLGDTLCFSSLLSAFLDFHKPKKVFLSTFAPHLFEIDDDRVVVVKSSDPTLIIQCDKVVNVGYDKDNLLHTINGMFYATKETMKLPLDTLIGKPPVTKKNVEKINNKIVIAPESLKKIARWEHFGSYGWQQIIDYLIGKGFDVFNVSYENTLNLSGVKSFNGFDDINIALDHIVNSRLFIGLSSGLSWLAWSYNIPVVMISGFTKEINEFSCYRVSNPVGCSGCFNIFQNIQSNCPLFINTIRENECHKKITPKMVIEKIDLALLEN
jgi:hypothetical protein